MDLTDAQRLKFEVLAAGITLTEACRSALSDANRRRPLTPADYASTTGLILSLEDRVWVNAPIITYNPNFVHNSPFVLDLGRDGMVLSGGGLTSSAAVWLPPDYHGTVMGGGRPWNNFVFTHGDRARLAPIGGCAMACKFCNIPFEDPYEAKPIDLLVEAVRIALEDSSQPARHLLISGGTPRSADVPYLKDVYRRILTEFPSIEVDIMMAPVEGLFDLDELADLGLHELSINLEMFDIEQARTVMSHKFRQGRDVYLAFIEQAAQALGPGRVRSMLMVGIEHPQHTIAGVEAIIDAGGVPVLSPFRPDPSTPMSDYPPLPAREMLDVFELATDVARRRGVELGPTCVPCTHNTISLADPTKAAPAGEGELLLVS